MKLIHMIYALLVMASLGAQDTTLAEKDVPKKVVAARNKKATALKHKDTKWSKNAAGEFVAVRQIGGNPAEDMPAEQYITARFKADGTWIDTENVLSPYDSAIKKKLVPKNIQAACLKLGSDEPFMPGGVTIKEMPTGMNVECSCGGKRVTFDKKAKVIKEE